MSDADNGLPRYADGSATCSGLVMYVRTDYWAAGTVTVSGDGSVVVVAPQWVDTGIVQKNSWWPRCI